LLFLHTITRLAGIVPQHNAYSTINPALTGYVG